MLHAGHKVQIPRPAIFSLLIVLSWLIFMSEIINAICYVLINKSDR